MKQVNIDECYETLMEDKTTGVSVWSLLKCSDEVSSEGYGMVIGKGDVKTALPQIRHGRMPRARYDATTGDLLIVGSDARLPNAIARSHEGGCRGVFFGGNLPRLWPRTRL